MSIKTYQDVLEARKKIAQIENEKSKLLDEIRQYYINLNKENVEKSEELQKIAGLTFWALSQNHSKTKQKLLLSFNQLFFSCYPVRLKERIEKLNIHYLFQLVEHSKQYWSTANRLGKSVDDIEQCILNPLGLFFGMPVWDILNATDFIDEEKLKQG